MTLSQFRTWAVNQGSVAKYDDGQYLGECVSLVNQYCWRVLNVPARAWGHAKDWGSVNNSNVLEHFNRVNTIQAGDILVWNGHYGGGFGHIAIALGNGQMIDQNGVTSRRVWVGNIWAGHSVVLRKKGSTSTMAKVSLEIARIVAHGVGGRNGVTNKTNALSGASDADLNRNHVGKNFSLSWVRNWFRSGEATKFRNDLAALKRTADRVPELEKRVKELEAQAGEGEFNALGKALVELLAKFGYKKG